MSTTPTPRKRCSKCRAEKDREFFRKCNANPDGLQAYCKECQADSDRERMAPYKSRRDELRKAWHASNPHKAMEYFQKYKPAQKSKIAIRQKAANAIKNGTLIRQPCEVCSHPATDAHHDDYSKPLEVRWLCRLHHNRLHHCKQPSL